MRTFVGSVLCCAIFTSVASASSLVDFLLPRPSLQVVTVTDVTPLGKTRRTASTAEPIYYLAVSAGYRDLGGIVAGEKPIAPVVVTRTIYKVLAKHGFLPASDQHPPQIVLIWVWGTLNRDMFYIPMNMPGWRPLQLNASTLMRFMGGEKVGLGASDPFSELQMPSGLWRRGDAAQAIYEAAQDDLYIIALSAYDRGMMDKEGAKSLLWRTRISCPSRGFWLPDVLPAMMAIAGPFVGRETPKPVWIDADKKFRPDITIGDPKVLGYLDQAMVPIEAAAPDKDVIGSP